jgi:hypothetical protein
MRSADVIILGLYKPSLAGWTANKLAAAGEVWTLNDWYWVYPTVRPDRVYNCHKPPWTHPDPRRYPGDWMAEYDHVAANYGTEIWTIHEIPGVCNQCRIPADEIEAAFPVSALTCQVCLMMAHAWMEGRRSIRLLGVTLSEDEYRYQAAGILKMSDILKERGVAVDNPHEQSWREREAGCVNWATIEGGLVPYWKRGGGKLPYWKQ